MTPAGGPGASAGDERLSLATPERVSLSLPVAGVGSRALAYLIDLGLIFAVLLLLYFVYSLLGPSLVELWQETSGLIHSLGALAVFGLTWLYWTLWEAFAHGQTPGKRWTHIRVVRGDGADAGLLECAIRNLLRIVDFLPICYPAGLITMLVDRQHRRLGDLVAGTVLVRDEAVNLDRYAVAPSSGAPSTLSNADLELITSYFERAAQLDPAARTALLAQLSTRLGGPAADPAAQEAFLKTKLGR